ncbi:hypothetical protein FA09DRAFT_34688 [Tilletiopsis washingtonensis]|uniref:Uncharacterized protein n=1 Tax=Tilletiopsis washingtonensis TaxID=58919 RepID=A0A316ZAE1_9BASI|nr:hypothetical protein FA09DRAFT_34688 [Tilletiopsis washingtonensis]PWN97978.1 hypothetical protein FA09DRAFT_34688 [Tilletiopsis washingtonensis]
MTHLLLFAPFRTAFHDASAPPPLWLDGAADTRRATRRATHWHTLGWAWPASGRSSQDVVEMHTPRCSLSLPATCHLVSLDEPSMLAADGRSLGTCSTAKRQRRGVRNRRRQPAAQRCDAAFARSDRARFARIHPL